MTTFEIIIFISLAINVFLGIAGLFLASEIRELRGEMRFFKDLDVQLVKAHEETNRTYDRLMDIYRSQTTMYTGIYEQYGKMEQSHKEICVEVNKLGEQHKKLLQCWENVEKRYSDSYEQFMHVNKQLIELNPVLKQITKEGVIFKAECESRSAVRRSPIVGPGVPDPEYDSVEVDQPKEANFVTQEKMEKVEEFLKEETAKKPRKSRKKEGPTKDVQAG